MSKSSFKKNLKNSEADASELQEYLEEMFLHYYINNDLTDRSKSSIAHRRVTRLERVILYSL